MFAAVCTLWGNPEAPGTAALSKGVVLTVGSDEEEVEGVGTLRRMPEIKPDSLVFETSDEGTRFLVLRIGTGDLAATRLYIRNMALPENAKVFVYGVTAGSVTTVVGPYEGAGPLQSGDFWTGAVAGSEIVVELQAKEVLADLPFEIVGLTGSDVSEVATSTPDAIEGKEDIRTSVFRGVALTHTVKNGKAIFEGDIELGNADELPRADSRSKNGSREAVAITGANYRWPGGIIPYSIDPTIPSPARVTDAIAHWNLKLTGHIQWVPRTNEKAFVNFVRSTSASTCSSAVGRMGFEQGISIGDSCVKGNIIHEMGHAVGLWHEQAREDRDQYVQILWENIKSDLTYNFTQSISNGDDLVVYDYGSIMHYPANSFSKNGLATIKTIPQGIAIGQRTALSASDILAVKTMYPTTNPAPAPTVTFESNPSALTITVDGVNYKTPKTFTWAPGSVHTVNAVNPTIASGMRNLFARWTDGGAQSHTIVAPTVSKVYRADYATSYSAIVTAATPGSVVVSPASTDTFYPKGQSVQLDAIAPPDHCFSSWTGLAEGTQASTKVTMSKAYTVNANYLPGGISVMPASLVVPVKASTQQITVTATTGCPWTAASPVTWIKITAGTSGNGSATVTLSVAARAATTPSRTATLTIAGQPVVITQ